MTIIVALRADDGVWIGSDGRVTENETVLKESQAKWYETTGGVRLAFSGSLRIKSLLETKVELLQGNDPILVAEAIRAAVVADDWKIKEPSDGPDDYNFDILATNGHSILNYNGAGCYVHWDAPGDFHAIGSGADYAMGALYVLSRKGQYAMSSDSDCYDLVEAALYAAICGDMGCGGDIHITKVPAK